MSASAIDPQARDRRRVVIGLLVAALIGGGPIPAEVASAGAEGDLGRELIRPHHLTTDLADVIVRIRGGANCTGTPIAETTLVVTAAHCVLDADGDVADARTVIRDGVSHRAVSVLVDPSYNDSPSPLRDVAVMDMGRVIPGPSATIGAAFPVEGRATLAGFQPLDADRSLLRGTRHDNRPRPDGATGGVIVIDTAATGCVLPVSDLEITDTQVNVPCGLIPGASGGGLFIERNGETILVGITSTVAPDLTYNGVAPLAALHELLTNPAPYTHDVASEASIAALAHAIRS